MNAYYPSSRVAKGSALPWDFKMRPLATGLWKPYTACMADPQLTYLSFQGQREGTMVVRLMGPLTLSTIFDFQTEFRAMRPPVLILDLSESPYMDSAGLGLVMNKYVSAESAHRKFLVTGVNGRIEALMELTRVNRVLSLFPSVEDAEASL